MLRTNCSLLAAVFKYLKTSTPFQMCSIVSPCRAISGAVIIPCALLQISQRTGLVVWCRRCDREPQLRPCLLGARAEGALHMSHMLHSCLLMPAWCFHSSRTFLTLTQFAAESSLQLLSHQMFPILHLCSWLFPCIEPHVFAFLICLLFLHFIFLFLLFWTISPRSFSILTQTSSGILTVPPSLTSFLNSTCTAYSLCQVKSVILTGTRSSTDHKGNPVSTSFHFYSYPPRTISRSM